MQEMSGLYMRFPGGKSKALTLSYDDGVDQDIRLIKIMKEYGLKGTFNVCSGMIAPEGTSYPSEQIRGRYMTSSQIKEISNLYGQEIAIHTLKHLHLEQFSLGTVAYQIVEDRRRLEEFLDCNIRGMAYPFGTVAATDEIVDIVKNSGVLYARTTQSTEDFWLPTNWLKLPATCHHNNPHLMELSEKFLGLKAEKNPRLFYLWGHSYEFDVDDNWQIIETFADKMGGHNNIWYATNMQIYDYVAAYKQLRFGLEMKFVENPSATDLFFKYSDNNYIVKAGSILKLA